jgi:uncharacterized cofD-like protein
MTRVRAIIFDLDDTLYDCTGNLSEAARRRAAHAMVASGLPLSEDEAYALQMRLADQYGPRCNVFDRIAEIHRLDDAFVETAMEAYNSDEVGDIKLFPDVASTLTELRRLGYGLFLVTSGIHRRQQKKIDLLGVGSFFDEIIVLDKERGMSREECFTDLMARHGLDAREILAVGDRIHSEIRIANFLKMTTAQMIHGRFKSLLPKNELEEPDYRIHAISDILPLLAKANLQRSQKFRRVVAIGGGTGLPIVLQGLKPYTTNLTALVTVMDSGRSSGTLREDLGVLPPGDARNCLVALSNTREVEHDLHDLFQYRFEEGRLRGMSFGNLFIAALEKLTGSFDRALREASRILAVEGKVIPSALTATHVCARLDDGSIVRQETNVRVTGKARIDSLFLDPPVGQISVEALEEIERASAIVLGPGSLYTSVITNLIVPGIRGALRRASCPLIYVCNIVTQPGQTDGYTASDHLKAVIKHLDNRTPDYVLVNDALPPEAVMARYRAGHAFPVPIDAALRSLCPNVVVADFVERFVPHEPQRILWEKSDMIRHDPDKLARAIMDIIGES